VAGLGQERQRVLAAAALGHVADQSDHDRGAAAVVDQHVPARGQPALGAVARQDPVLEAVVGPRPDGLHDGGLEAGAVVGVHELEEAGQGRGRLAALPAVERAERVRPADAVCRDLPLPEPGVGAFQGEPHPVLADAAVELDRVGVGQGQQHRRRGLHGPVLPAEREAGGDPEPVPVGVRARAAQDLDRVGRLAALERAGHHRLDLAGERGHDVRERSAGVLLGRDARELRQRLVDPHEAVPAIEEREPPRRRGEPALEGTGSGELRPGHGIAALRHDWDTSAGAPAESTRTHHPSASP
jgi:hypothetical protein